MLRRNRLAVGLTAGIAAALLAAGGLAGAEEEGGGGMTPQPKIDHAFVKGLVGAWDYVATMGGEEAGKGSVTYRLGLLDTAVIEDLDGTLMGGPFQGHGVWKVAADGKGLTLWWFDNYEPKPQAYAGTLSADGYEITEETPTDPTKIAYKKTATGGEMNFTGAQGSMKIVLTKRK